MKAIHMRRRDLAVDADYLPPPDAPALLRRALRDPLCVPSAADSIAARMEEASALSALQTVAGLIDVSVRRHGPPRRAVDPVAVMGRLYASCGARVGEEERRAWRTAFEALPGPAREAVAALVEGVARSRVEVKGALGRLTPGADSESCRKVGGKNGGIVARATATDFPFVALIADSLDEREARRVVAIAAKIDRGRLVEAALDVAASVEAARAALGGADWSGVSGRARIDLRRRAPLMPKKSASTKASSA